MLEQKTAVATPALRVDEQAALLSAENLSDFIQTLAKITSFTSLVQKLNGADNPVFEPVRPLLKAISELSRACNVSIQDPTYIGRVSCVMQPQPRPQPPGRLSSVGITAVWCLPSLGAQAEG